jgi:hypothetical protein
VRNAADDDHHHLQRKDDTMTKKTKTTEPTEPPPDYDAIIAEGLQIGLNWIAEELGTKIQWSTLIVAAMRNGARSDVDRALRPPPLPGPPPLVSPAPQTTPRARTKEEVDRGYRP